MPSFQLWSSSQTDQEPFCSSLTFLTIEQRYLCQTNPKIFAIISRSLRQAIEECQYQFRNQRWNCSIFNQSDVFGKLILRSKLALYDNPDLLSFIVSFFLFYQQYVSH